MGKLLTDAAFWNINVNQSRDDAIGQGMAARIGDGENSSSACVAARVAVDSKLSEDVTLAGTEAGSSAGGSGEEGDNGGDGELHGGG